MTSNAIQLIATDRPSHYRGLGYPSGHGVPVVVTPDGTYCYAVPEPDGSEIGLYSWTEIVDGGDHTIAKVWSPRPVFGDETGRNIIVGGGEKLGTVEA